MAIIPWEPFKDLDRFFEDEWDFMPVIPFKGKTSPQVDIFQDKKNVYVEMSLAGVKPEDIEIAVEDGVLTVSGKAEDKKEEKGKDYFRKEIRRGAFERSISLPVKVKEQKAEAEFKDGILKITLPRSTEVKTKKVKVRVKK